MKKVKYKISGSTTPAKKGKAITFGYEPFSTDSIDEFIAYINTHATIPVNVKAGHRRTENITEIYDWIRLDVDKEDMYKNVEKQLNEAGVSYIKKPSTSNVNKGMDWKWHYFIETEGISQNYDIYRQQYYKFLTDVGIDTSWIDMSLSSVVQNMSICGEDGIKKTEVVKGKTWIAPQGLTAPKPPKHNKKSSDTPKNEIKKALSKIDVNEITYEEWLNVGFALYDWCPKRGFKLYDKWSKPYKKYNEDTGEYKEYDKSEVISKWRDFSRNARGDITVGTLMHLAYGEKDTFENEKPLSKEEKKRLKTDFDYFIENKVRLEVDDIERTPLTKCLFNQSLHMFHGLSGTFKSNAVVTEMARVDKEHKYYIDIELNGGQLKQRCEENGIKYIPSNAGIEMMKTILKRDFDLSDTIIAIDSFNNFVPNELSQKDSDDVAGLIKIMHDVCVTKGATIIIIDHSTALERRSEDGTIDPRRVKVEGNATGKEKNLDFMYKVVPNDMTDYIKGVKLFCEKTREPEYVKKYTEIQLMDSFFDDEPNYSDLDQHSQENKVKWHKKDYENIQLIKQVMRDIEQDDSKYARVTSSRIKAETGMSKPKFERTFRLMRHYGLIGFKFKKNGSGKKDKVFYINEDWSPTKTEHKSQRTNGGF